MLALKLLSRFRILGVMAFSSRQKADTTGLGITWLKADMNALI